MSIIYEDMGSSVNLSQLKKISELEIENRMLNEVSANLAIKYNEALKEKFKDRQDFEKLEAKIKDLEAKLKATKPEEPVKDPYKFEVKGKTADMGEHPYDTLRGYFHWNSLFKHHYVIESSNTRYGTANIVCLNYQDLQTIITKLQKVLDDGVLSK